MSGGGQNHAAIIHARYSNVWVQRGQKNAESVAIFLTATLPKHCTLPHILARQPKMRLMGLCKLAFSPFSFFSLED